MTTNYPTSLVGLECLARLYTLVLKKTEVLFAREQETRIRDQTDLEWLAAQWNLRA